MKLDLSIGGVIPFTLFNSTVRFGVIDRAVHIPGCGGGSGEPNFFDIHEIDEEGRALSRTAAVNGWQVSKGLDLLKERDMPLPTPVAAEAEKVEGERVAA